MQSSKVESPVESYSFLIITFPSNNAKNPFSLHGRGRADNTRGVVVVTSRRRLRLGKATSAGGQVQPVAVDGLVEGLPAGRLPWDDAENVHGVDLLEGPLLRLVDEEEGDQDTEETAAGKDVAVAVVDGARDPGGEEGDEEVPQPVGGGAETHGDGAVAGGEHFSDDGPDEGTPLFSMRVSIVDLGKSGLFRGEGTKLKKKLTVIAKPTMNKHAEAIMALPALELVTALGSSGLLSGYRANEPSEAKMRSQANIHRPPTIMEIRRPNF